MTAKMTQTGDNESDGSSFDEKTTIVASEADDVLCDIVGGESSSLLIEKGKAAYGAVEMDEDGDGMLVDEEKEEEVTEYEYEAAIIQEALKNGQQAWTEEEENVVRRKTDIRVMVLACVMFFSLDLDRSNIQQVLSSDFLIDTRMSTDDYNIGQSLFLIFFLSLEVPSQLMNKRFGPERWLPTIMTAWGIVSTVQFLISSRPLFLFTRAALGFCEGGFVSGLAFYVSSFYKTDELSIRLSWIWATQAGTNVLSALMASGILLMTDVGSLKNWQWLLLLEGILTTGIGIATFFLIPSLKKPGIASTFTPREAAILRARVEHDDPSKKNQSSKDVGKRQTPGQIARSVFGALTDKYLAPVFLLGYIGFIPSVTLRYYFPINMRFLNFSTTTINLLIIPYALINIFMTTTFSRLSDYYRKKWVFAVLSAIWVFPNLIFLQYLPYSASRWWRFASYTWVLGYPYYQPILVSWVSANSNDPDRRALAQSLYNIAVQLGNLTAANVFRTDDAPYYHKGTYVLLALNIASMFLAFGISRYFMAENKRRDQVWEKMTELEREEYTAHSTDKGNVRLDFRLRI
ncbi:major facilitator superfamily domain-containing protein [Limtongia smithiae]|uniref:major facilitator superfamily domain-containing protein n=1 Tax=Limtongia smithiae TaxID=1125753 RepID=UPI0034CE4F25